MAMENGIRDREDDAWYTATEWVEEPTQAEILYAEVNAANEVRFAAIAEVRDV